ncbi:MAG TPA: tripartite tricarboxylate transporter TctB family protein [Methylomirabilota bacterium]|nr:tripartite tricarboxylate transporter TctB family protein [Methylomirabilota bacterium]
MRAAELLTVALLLGLGGVVLFDALRLGIGWGTDGPQSGFFPFWLATALVVTTGAIAIQTLVRGATRPFVTREQMVPVLKVVAPLTGFVVLTDPPGPWSGLGLYVAAALYLGFYMRWVGRHRWPTVLAVAILIPVIAFVIFERWFLVPMPKGPLEDWLGY